MSDRLYRTDVGDRVRDHVGGDVRIVLDIWRAEDLGGLIRGTYYRGGSAERCALYGTHARRDDRKAKP